MAHPDPSSNPALEVARHLARHQHHDHGALFADPLALPLAALTQEALTTADAPQEATIRSFLAARNRIAEDRLARAVTGGTRQIVILGGGFGTLGLRAPHAASGATTFEVDRPAALAEKQSRMEAAALDMPGSLRLVACDWEKDGLLPALEAAGFNPFRPVFFICLGLIPHLTMEMNDAILRFISSLPRGEVVYDYGEPEAAFSPLWQDALAGSGATPRLAFSARDMADLLELTNFRWYEDLTLPMAPDLLALPAPETFIESGLHIVHARA